MGVVSKVKGLAETPKTAVQFSIMAFAFAALALVLAMVAVTHRAR